MSPSARMLLLLSLLQSHRYWPGSELARRLEVSERTLRRDVERLRDLGYPVDSDRGVGGGYQLAPGAVLPPLVLDDDEAVAIAVGLQAAAQAAIAGMEESSVRALTKVVQVMPPRLRRRVDALRAVTVPAGPTGRSSGASGVGGPGGALVDAGALTTVAQAARDAEALRFDYRSARGWPRERHVEPHRLVCLGRRWYLVGFDLGPAEWRTFRLDRLAQPVATGRRFRPRELPADDAAAFVRAGLEAVPGRYAVEVRVHAPAARVRAEVDRWGTVEALDAGTCVLRCSTDSLDWPAFVLGATGADFDVVSPPELVELLRGWQRRFARATSGGVTDAGAGGAGAPAAVPTA